MTPRVLYCHGLESGPGGYKVLQMREQGLDVTAPAMKMSLWDARESNSLVRSLFSPSALLSRWPSQWLPGAMDDSFDACVAVQREALAARAGHYDVLVGSSWGGAVAAALLASGSWQGPTLLLCPALYRKDQFGSLSATSNASIITAGLAALPAAAKARCLLVHGSADETVPLDDSRALSAATGIPLEVVDGGSHGLGKIIRDGRLVQYVQRLASIAAR